MVGGGKAGDSVAGSTGGGGGGGSCSMGCSASGGGDVRVSDSEGSMAPGGSSVAWSGGRSQSVTQTLSSTVGGCSGGGGFGAGGGGSDDGGNDDTLVGLSSSARTLTANFATRECAALSLTPETNRQAPRPPRLASCASRIAAMTF